MEKVISLSCGYIQMVIQTGFQNSIITFMSVNEKRYQQYLRNRRILYKRE